MQFNLFAEDPIATSIAMVPMPWIGFFDRQRELQTPLLPNVDRTVDEEDGEVYEDSLMLWKNEDWGTGSEVQKAKKNDEKSPWAGKNPVMACRVGQKSLTGQYCAQLGEMNSDISIVGIAYSPDGRTLATVSDDGMLRLIDVMEERCALPV